MRVVGTDTAPARLNKYLLPKERQVISVRQHPAVLARPVFFVLVGLAFAGWLSNSVANGNGGAILAIWVAWGVLLVWLVIKLAQWSVYVFAVTSERLMLSQGLVVRKVNMIPLSKVTDVEFQRSAAGQFLGFGEFEVIAAGVEPRLRYIKYVPYPEQLYLEICGLMFKDKDDKDDSY